MVASAEARSMSETHRVLIVDDDALVARSTARWLRRRGYQVVTASTGQLSLQASGPFLCAIVDVDLPDGSGLDFAERLVGSAVVHRIVFYSGSIQAGVRERAERIGVFVSKLDGIGELGRAVTGQASHSFVGVRQGEGEVEQNDEVVPPKATASRGRSG
jgi:ActR/RegA family two-component response regulator